MRICLLALLAAIGIYQLIPNIYARHFNDHVNHRITTSRHEIALTFDDGPDETYTPELLDLLKLENIHATFFLVAEHAKAHPEIVARMKAEGHAVGLHSLSHRGFWLETPRQTRLDFQESLKIFQSLDVDLVGFRPPWGTFNLLTSHYAAKARLPVYLWSRNAQDWKRETTPDDIVERITAELTEGEIIVLHDAGGDQGAPGHTIEALRTALPTLKEQFEFVTLEKGNKGHELDTTEIPSI